ncbi:unnamed protein product [Kuraishia capsulata CBS 1993]|uniref:BTB domain-containing protein n=1 Tax=Kuraishia capsulata CBS 1993 TaxID=1382522 RepID=W6MF38_9ASCO|nr:uncharacterized protein KUCA_T00000174001 [Kuraishia capsulata CBS 1993]CDK24214.1 unnamed protein product [Kuraishia capsulata CBS 1993]
MDRSRYRYSRTSRSFSEGYHHLGLVGDSQDAISPSSDDSFLNDVTGIVGEDSSADGAVIRAFALPSDRAGRSGSRSRDTKQSHKSKPVDKNVCPFGCCVTESLGKYVFQSGLLDGLYSDVTIEAFGETYKLHKLLLHKSGYFRSLFEWKNIAEESGTKDDSDEENVASASSKDYYRLEFDDSKITNAAFKLATSRLYGSPHEKQEREIPQSMIAIGQYLGMPDVVCHCTNYIVNSMNMDNVAENLQFATQKNYGSASSKIVECGKGILCSDGWQVGAERWDGIPAEIIAEVVGEDYFFVPSEWDRCMFIIKLIEQRTMSPLHSRTPSRRGSNVTVSEADSLKDSGLSESQADSDSEEEDEEVVALREALNSKVHFCHLSPEQLQDLEGFYDMNGLPYVDPHVLRTALWQGIYLQRKIVTSHDAPQLGLSIQSNEEPEDGTKWYSVPTQDETWSALPSQLSKFLFKHSAGRAADGLSSSDSDLMDAKTTDVKEGVVPRWTNLPPFRFSVAFANISDLSKDMRIYGKTFWYAGSYWNLYLQKNHMETRDSYQVGVYLHRANSSSPGPSRNGIPNPDIFAGTSNYSQPPRRYTGHKQSFAEGSRARQSPVPISLTESLVREDGEEDGETYDEDVFQSFTGLHLNPVEPARPNRLQSPQEEGFSKRLESHNDRSFLTYEDTRTSIRVYFVIFTPNRKTRPLITSFLSVPNDFNRSQSWGWKSNSMCVFNEDGTFPEGHDPNMKFTVVLGAI